MIGMTDVEDAVDSDEDEDGALEVDDGNVDDATKTGSDCCAFVAGLTTAFTEVKVGTGDGAGLVTE